MAADRHLLFGLLALQTGLIQQAQLVAAFHAWTCDKSRSLAEHLMALGHLDSTHRPLLEGLAAAHLDRHGGDVEKSLAAVPAGRSTRESLAELADADIAASLGHLGSASTHADRRRRRRPHGQLLRSARPPPDGQRFRVLRPHARGGLGAVFVALDAELNREVALKQILDQHADDPDSRQRFLLEAEITGGLEHPGIVPVYGLGTYADGRPFYAMRFIRGDSLKEAIDRFHADLANQGRSRPPVAASCASCCAASRTSATRSSYAHSARRACTATSSRATSSSASTARHWWSTGAWPRPRAGPTPARSLASGRWSRRRPAGPRRRCRAARWGRRPT